MKAEFEAGVEKSRLDVAYTLVIQKYSDKLFCIHSAKK